MIPNYIRPQSRIFQLLDVTETASADRINALVLGPAFLLSRYGVEDTPSHTFEADTDGQTLPFTYLDSGVETALPQGHTVDLDSVRVHGEDLWGTLASITGDLVADGNTLELEDGTFRGTSLNAAFDGRDIQVGDVVRVTNNTADTTTRTVLGFVSDAVLTLSGPPVISGTAASAAFYTEFSGEIPSTDGGDTLWTADASGVEFNDGFALSLEGKASPAPVLANQGTLTVSFRAFKPVPANQGYVSIRSTSDIEDYAGPVDLDNDLAYGTSRALLGAQGKRVYSLQTADYSASAFAEALRKVEATDFVYALAPLTTDEAAQEACVAHVAAMSQPETKNFRRVYVGTDSPGEYTKLEDAAYTAQSYDGNSNSYITLTDGGLLAAGVLVGDKLATGEVISQVVSDTELILGEVGPGASGSLSVVAADTPENQISFLIRKAQSFNSRRAMSVWAEGGTAFIRGAFRSVPVRFVASEIAGLRSALAPQQGLTKTEITTITGAPAMYTRYTPDQLDQIAQAGTFIVTQDVESGVVFIRHQLTTKTDEGSLAYEDSAGVVIDSVSFRVKDVIDSRIGKRNVTPQTISEIRGLVRDILQESAEADDGDPAGPEIISYDDLIVRAHSVLKDRIEILFTIDVALPLNNVDVYVRASVGLTI